MLLYKQTYLSVGLILIASVLVIFLANLLMKEEVKHVKTVRAMKGTPQQRYDEALEMVIEGDIEQARVTMFRLARLGDSADRPLGLGKAHLWVAEDKLTHFKPDFIWTFPGLNQGGVGPITLPVDEETLTIQNHLAHAVVLNPELEKAVTLWVATLVSQGQRNRAVEILENAIAHSSNPHPGLHVPLAHLLAMEVDKGQELELKDRALYSFTSLGKKSRYSRGKDISDRLRYIISALVLKRYEHADNAIRVLEARLPAGQPDDTVIADTAQNLFIQQIKALRMAYHYHRAIDAFQQTDAKVPSSYGAVVDELEKVVLVSPGCEPAIAAMSQIAETKPTERARIAAILKGVLDVSRGQISQAKSAVNMSLAKMNPEQKGDQRKLLEDAVAADHQNVEAVLRLTGLMLADESPDYQRIEKLSQKALKNAEPVYHSDLNHRLGEVQARQQNWINAIILLEKSLAKASDKAGVHALLAEAYTAMGDATIANEHKKLASKGGN